MIQARRKLHLYDRQDPKYRRSWAELKRAGIVSLRCGHWSRKTEKECSLPQGHRGPHDFTINLIPIFRRR